MRRTAARSTADTALLVVLAALLVSVCVAAFFHLQIGAQAGDAHAQRAVVDRVARLGGTYYTTGTDQKGPLWLASYSIVDHLSGPATFWFMTALMIMTVAAVTSVLVGQIVRAFDVPAPVPLAISAATFTYLVLGPEEYSRVLYSRNLVTMCFAGAIALLIRALRTEPERRRLLLAAGAGAAAGLGAQTMPSSSLLVVVLVAVLLIAADGRRLFRIPLVTLAFGSAASVSYLSVFAWYAARGALPDFWQQWYSYNKTYSQATGSGLGDQLQAGWTTFGAYYRDHWVLAAGIAGYLLVVIARWARADSAQRALLALPLAWWATECLSVTSAQRFFPHYFVLSFTPAVVMLGVTIGALLRFAPQLQRFVPAIGLVLAVGYASGREAFDAGIRQAASFDSLGQVDDEQRETMAPDRQQVRAIADLLTEPDDFVYIWSKAPWRYTDARRSAASRYIENRWLTGEIYGATMSADFIFPNAWSNLIDDLEQVDPPLVIEALAEPTPIPASSVLATFLADHYDVVYESRRFRVYFEAGRFASEFGASGASSRQVPWTISEGSDWSATSGGLRYGGQGANAALDAIELDLGDCFAMSLQIDTLTSGVSALPAFVNTEGIPPRDYVGITFWPDKVVTAVVENATIVGRMGRVVVDPTSHDVRIVARDGAFGAIIGERFVAVAPRNHRDWAFRPWQAPFELNDLLLEESPAHCAADEVAER